MATYPNLSLEVLNGQLGQLSSEGDGICALIVADDLSAATDPVIADGDTFTLRQFTDAADEGLDQLDFTYRQIKEFYNEAPAGTKLYVKCVENYDLSETEYNTPDNVLDKAHADAYAKTLLDAYDDIRFLGVCFLPDDDYVAAVTNGFDDAAYAGLAKGQALLADYEADFRPAFALIEGREYQGVASGLTDLTAGTDDRCGVVLGNTEEADTAGVNDLSAAVGLVMGRIANNQVQRKISATADGSLAVTKCYVPDADGNSEDVRDHDMQTISEAGYITFRTFVSQNGYYIADDPLAASASSDYNNITNRRVIDKIIRIAYATYFTTLNSEVPVDTATGYIDATVIKNLQAKIDNAVNTAMTGEDEISDFESYIDPAQNIISTGKLTIQLKPTPVGYARQIEIEVGFTNPFN